MRVEGHPGARARHAEGEGGQVAGEVVGGRRVLLEEVRPLLVVIVAKPGEGTSL